MEQPSPTFPHPGDGSLPALGKQDDTLASTPSEPAPQQVPASLVTSWKSFTEACEFFKPDEDGKMVFSRTSLLTLDSSDGTVYFGWIEVRKRELSLEQARDCLQRIPADEIYPPLPADMFSLKVASAEPGHHIKRPKFASYRWAAGTKQLADRFLEEARTLHLVQRNPHANLVGFEGCLVEDGRIIGLLLKRYPTTLSDRVKAKDNKALDRASCLRGIVDGLKHLHSLGMAHNDVNPSNVMLDEEDRPVIVDLGSCTPFGERLTEGGTPGWNDGFGEEFSRASNDEIGLRKVGEWLGITEKLLNLLQVV